MAVVLHPMLRLKGPLRPPGDKSITHRALLFGAVAGGNSLLGSPGRGEDVQATRRALATLGIPVADDGEALRIDGKGWDGLPAAGAGPFHLDCANSGTTARLLLGLLAGRRGVFHLEGDASLSQRPMRRVTGPLSRMGARISGEDHLPLAVRGGPLRGCALETGVASAQVKSALILAALQAEGESAVTEPVPTRDHTERLLAAMGAPPVSAGEGLAWRVPGGCPSLRPLHFLIPGDPSSAAPLVALAAALPGSELAVHQVGLNPRRTGFFRLLRRMGAGLEWQVEAAEPEPQGTLVVRGGALKGIAVGPDEVVDAIDELPLLAVLGAVAEGETAVRGAGELRLKESDRIARIVAVLRRFGAAVEELPDGFAVRGPARLGGAAVDPGADHRIAMAAAVAASLARGESRLQGEEWVGVSYPGFFADLARLGTRR